MIGFYSTLPPTLGLLIVYRLKRGQSKLISRRICVWFVSLVWALSAYGGCNSTLSTRVPDVNIQQPSALAALLQFGSENGICLAVEAPGLDLLKRPGRIQASRPAVAYVIQTLLDGGAYQLSESNGVILIRNADAMGQMTQLDLVVPEYTITKLSVAWANLALHVRLERLADPSIQGIGVSLSDRHPEDQIGPMDERGRTARELLTLIVSESPGGAWVSGQCLGPMSESVCWTVIQYRDEPEIVAAMIGNLVNQLTTERASKKVDKPQ